MKIAAFNADAAIAFVGLDRRWRSYFKPNAAAMAATAMNHFVLCIDGVHSDDCANIALTDA